jgi:hypothetical protein
MPRAGDRDLAKEQHWREVFADWKSSGLTAVQFCQEKGIKIPAFYEWRRQIARRDAQTARAVRRKQATAPRSGADVAQADKKGTNEFAEVRVVERRERMPDANSSAPLEIVFQNGTRIHFRDECSLRLLASVLKLLENR